MSLRVKEKTTESHGIKEGKIVDSENVSGSLDDDDLEEYSDF